MKFARTIRFDKSDLNIFPRASEEGELAVVGTFSFYNDILSTENICFWLKSSEIIMNKLIGVRGLDFIISI